MKSAAKQKYNSAKEKVKKHNHDLNTDSLKVWCVWLNWLGFIAHLTVAIVFMVLIEDKTFHVDTYVHLSTWYEHIMDSCDTNCSMEWKLTPISQYGGAVHAEKLLYINHFISAGCHLIILANAYIKHNYLVWLHHRIQPVRWLEYFVTSSNMTLLISLLMGVDDVLTLVLLWTVNAFVMAFGLVFDYYDYLLEKLKENGTYEASLFETWIVQWFGWFLFLMQWAVMYIAFVLSTEETPAPDFVQAIILTIFILYNLFGLNQVMPKLVSSMFTYDTSEIAYILLSIIAKTTLTFIVYQSLLNSPAAEESESTM